MTVMGKGWAAAKPTTGSSYVAFGRNARKTPLLAVILQLGDMTVGANRTESTEITVPSWIVIFTRVTVVTVTLYLLCRNLVTAISLASLFRLFRRDVTIFSNQKFVCISLLSISTMLIPNNETHESMSLKEKCMLLSHQVTTFQQLS
jgi:hypothetical protein